MHSMYVAWNEVTLYIGAWFYGVHRMCAKTAAVLCGTNHVTTKWHCKYITSVAIHLEPHVTRVHGSAPKQRIALYKSNQLISISSVNLQKQFIHLPVGYWRCAVLKMMLLLFID